MSFVYSLYLVDKLSIKTNDDKSTLFLIISYLIYNTMFNSFGVLINYIAI